MGATWYAIVAALITLQVIRRKTGDKVLAVISFFIPQPSDIQDRHPHFQHVFILVLSDQVGLAVHVVPVILIPGPEFINNPQVEPDRRFRCKCIHKTAFEPVVFVRTPVPVVGNTGIDIGGVPRHIIGINGIVVLVIEVVIEFIRLHISPANPLEQLYRKTCLQIIHPQVEHLPGIGQAVIGEDMVDSPQVFIIIPLPPIFVIFEITVDRPGQGFTHIIGIHDVSCSVSKTHRLFLTDGYQK